MNSQEFQGGSYRASSPGRSLRVGSECDCPHTHKTKEAQEAAEASQSLSCLVVAHARASAESLSRGLRYDHFSVLCELLPVGIPSLAVCLQALLHGMVPCSSQEAKSRGLRLPPPLAGLWSSNP